MSESESQNNRESLKKNLQKNDFNYMNAEIAHNTYANLICREDKEHKKSMSFMSQELKDISRLRPNKQSQTTFDLEPKKLNQGKKIIKVQKNFIKKNFDISEDNTVPKNKKKFIQKKFDNLYTMTDYNYNKNYKTENKFQNEKNKNKKQTLARQRKLTDQYEVNPIEILDKKKIEEMNNSNRKKLALRTKAFNDYMGSKRTQHLFKTYKTSPVFIDKITNTPANILNKSIRENRKTQPMYLRYKFKHYLVPKNKIGTIDNNINDNKNNENKGNDKNNNNKNIRRENQICQFVE